MRPDSQRLLRIDIDTEAHPAMLRRGGRAGDRARDRGGRGAALDGLHQQHLSLAPAP